MASQGNSDETVFANQQRGGNGTDDVGSGGAGGADPDATFIGDSAETVSADSGPADDPSASNGDVPDPAQSHDPQATYVGADVETVANPQTRRSPVRNAGLPGKADSAGSGGGRGEAGEATLNDPEVESGGHASLQQTMLGGQQVSDQTYIPEAGDKKDSEDFYETLVDDGRERSGNDVSGMIIGDYQVISVLGRGGMGVVYKARHRKLDRIAALKMILAGEHAGGDMLERFISEARAVAHLQHPGIVQIFDIGEHKGQPYFSLEFVPGEDLQRKLNGQPISDREAAEMMRSLCDAMHYAHENKILHRDLKPANVLVSQDGTLKITDFGLAKKVDPEASGATTDGTVMGSPSYMPPEQARGEMSSVTPRSDLYSLGAILYQMLTGRPPFVSDRPLQTVMQVINNDAVDVRSLRPDVSKDLETICMKALQKDPETRYADCRALAADLTRFLNGEPILARPVSRAERLWRWCRRNPTVAVPSGMATLLLIATAAVSTWAWNETSAQAAVIATERDNVKEERDEAQRQRDEAQRQRIIANEQQALAEENEELARSQANLALKNIQFVITAIDDQLREQPGVQDVRLRILEAMDDKWDDLDVELTGGIRGEAVPTLMSIRCLMSRAYLQLDQLEPAGQHLNQLETLARERIALKDGTDSTRFNLAGVLAQSYQIAERVDGDAERAKTMLQEAIDLIQDCLDNPRPQPGSPTANEMLSLLAQNHQNLGVLWLREGRLPTTAVHFQASLDANLNVLANIEGEAGFADLNEDQRDGKTAGLKIGLDKSRIGLGYIRLRMRETEAALRLYDEAIASRREIFDRRSSMAVIRNELAGHLRSLASRRSGLESLRRLNAG